MSDRDRFDRFTERTRRVLSLAQEEAQLLQHRYVGTEHLLLGIVREKENVAAHILSRKGVELAKVRSVIEFIIGRGNVIVVGEIDLTPQAKQMIELATDEASRLNHHYIGPEHLLMAMIRQGEGVGVSALESLGVNLKETHRQIIQYISPFSYREPYDNEHPRSGGPSPSEQESAPSAGSRQTTTSSDGFDKFSERAKRVLNRSQEEAQRFQHNYIGTEHFLLGLVGEEECTGARILMSLGVELKQVRSAVEFIIGRGDRIVASEIGLTAGSKKVIELAVDEARRIGHYYIGTEHFLLGLVREGEGIAAGVLESLGVNLEKARNATIQLLSSPNVQPSPTGPITTSTEPVTTSRDQFDKFTENARRLLSLSQEEAHHFQHNYIGTEHLLLGLIRVKECTGARILISLGVELNKVRGAIEFIIGRGDQIVVSEIGLTPRSKKVIELAVNEARRLNHHYIGTEHILLGMVREGEGIAAGVLESLGVDLEKTRHATIQYLSFQNDQSSSMRSGISSSDQFDNFTAPAKNVLDLAQDEAHRFRHHYLGTEHLLLGLLRAEENIATQILIGMGAKLNKARSGVEFIIGRGDQVVPGERPLTPRSKKVIELAVAEARLLNHHYIGPEHLLLGLLREGDGIAGGIIESFGIDLEEARRQTLEQISAQSDQLPSITEVVSFAEIIVSHRIHLFTLPFCHVTANGQPRTYMANWLQGIAAAGWPLPLALAHDLGLLLSLPANQRTIVRPSFLPFDEDTSAYIACLERLATHPLVRELPSWSPPLTDAILSILLARLVEGLDLPQEYRLPTGPDGVRFLRALNYEVARADPATLWEQTPADARPSWRRLLPPAALTRLEHNLHALDREELRFLTQYGPGLPGSPDPRTLLDLLALTGLPAPARLALSQTLRLLPHVINGTTQRLGGIQTYPEGGYEGLARQGSLESLLPGENVYPDVLFLHRVLNNEALYYGRERPREQRREVAYLVGQLGWGLGGDGQVLVRVLLLALGQAMRQRGYDVFYSLAGATLSAPAPLEKPTEVGRLLYAQERGGVNSKAVLQGVLEQLRAWRSDYRGRQVFWVLSEDFDADTVQEHTSLYQALRAEGEQQAWYVRVGPVPAQLHSAEPLPVTAHAFGHWQIMESGRLWESEKI